MTAIFFYIFVDDFMSNINCGIGVVHVKNVKYWRIFCDVNSLLAQVFIISYESQWIDNDPISVLYEFQIDISTNSWEIKYQNMGIGLIHVKRRTRQTWR